MKLIKFIKEHKFFFSFIINLLFIFYTYIVGFIYNDIWCTSLFYYYILLIIVKFILIKNTSLSKTKLLLINIILFLINLIMIYPVIIMIKLNRNVSYTLIPAIGIATYTFYNLAISITTFIKNYKKSNIVSKHIIVISLLQTIMSILTLQNTLIMVNTHEYNKGLYILTIISSSAGVLFCFYLVLVNYLKCIKEY